ncbi:hypothetical protein CFB89_07165 [Burkholderia sp. AU16741]|uniref:hypothetical protein n=1 Tax=Burkholderia sp. AU16741 TaxID=2015347 RepID=UPI000B7AAACB|nr:hypothetical protein [Burkholderia sp. AU16741]OXI34530.1 hypothetical protein CFB89_07165 [Burkholderia sp. AU16741]
MLHTILDALSPGWVGTTVSLLAFIVGVALAIWGILISSKRPRPAVVRLNRRLLGGPMQMLPKNIQILFDGKPVPHIMRTLIWVWNAGNATLRGDDIVAKDRLRLEYASKTQVLSVRVLKVTRTVIGFTASPRDNSSQILIDFDFLDGEDGALIEILHTGKGTPAFLGTIKGVPSVWMPGKSKEWTSRLKEGTVGPPTSVGMSVIIVGITMGKIQSDFAWWRTIQMVFVGVGVVLMLFSLIMQLLRRRYRVPRSLEESSSDQRNPSDAKPPPRSNA